MALELSTTNVHLQIDNSAVGTFTLFCFFTKSAPSVGNFEKIILSPDNWSNREINYGVVCDDLSSNSAGVYSFYSEKSFEKSQIE